MKIKIRYFLIRPPAPNFSSKNYANQTYFRLLPKSIETSGSLKFSGIDEIDNRLNFESHNSTHNL